jgi:hypothetical protein
LIRNVAVVALLATLAAAAIGAAAGWDPPDPAQCPSLVELSERTHDVAAPMTEAGCVDSSTGR